MSMNPMQMPYHIPINSMGMMNMGMGMDSMYYPMVNPINNSMYNPIASPMNNSVYNSMTSPMMVNPIIQGHIPFTLPNNVEPMAPPQNDTQYNRMKEQFSENRRGNDQPHTKGNNNVDEEKSKFDGIKLEENSDDDSFGEDMKRIKSQEGKDVYIHSHKKDNDEEKIDTRTEEQKKKDQERSLKNKIKKQKRRERQKARKAEMQRKMMEIKHLQKAQLKLMEMKRKLSSQNCKDSKSEDKDAQLRKEKAEKKRLKKLRQKQRQAQLKKEQQEAEDKKLAERLQREEEEEAAFQMNSNSNCNQKGLELQKNNSNSSKEVKNPFEINQPDNLEEEFVYEYDDQYKGDELTRGDYDDIVNVIRNNIGEGAFVNEDDYIGIQYMNDLVLVQSFIDKKLELQIAKESDVSGKININNRQDFPNFEPNSSSKKNQFKEHNHKQANLIQAQLEQIEKQNLKKSEFIVVKKGKKRGKKKNDQEKDSLAYMQQNLGGFDVHQLQDFSYGKEYVQQEDSNKPLQTTLENEFNQEGAFDQQLGLNQGDYMTDAQLKEYLTKLEGGNDAQPEENKYYYEKSKKKDNPLNYVKLAQPENPEYLNGLYRTYNRGNAVSSLKQNKNSKGPPAKQDESNTKTGFDIGTEIEKMEENRKSKKGGQNQWSSMAQDYILSASKESESFLLSLHSIFPRLALGRLKMFFSLLGDSFDLTKSFLLRKLHIFQVLLMVLSGVQKLLHS